MQNLHIKLKISDREYSLRIDSKDEQLLRKAAKLLNNQLKEKKEKFGIRDKQDLMAMVAFDGVVNSLKSVEKNGKVSEHILTLEKMIAAHLE